MQKKLRGYRPTVMAENQHLSIISTKILYLIWPFPVEQVCFNHSTLLRVS